MNAEQMMMAYLSWISDRDSCPAPFGLLERRFCDAEAKRMGFIEDNQVTKKGMLWVIGQLEFARPLMKKFFAEFSKSTTAGRRLWCELEEGS